MPIQLNGSFGTGEKILQHFDFFKYKLIKHKPHEYGNSKTDTYTFEWNFYRQCGNVNISVIDNRITTGSTIHTNPQSNPTFSRSLGLYNDRTLEEVFRLMLQSIDVKTIGLYDDSMDFK